MGDRRAEAFADRRADRPAGACPVEALESTLASRRDDAGQSLPPGWRRAIRRHSRSCSIVTARLPTASRSGSSRPGSRPGRRAGCVSEAVARRRRLRSRARVAARVAPDRGPQPLDRPAYAAGTAASERSWSWQSRFRGRRRQGRRSRRRLRSSERLSGRRSPTCPPSSGRRFCSLTSAGTPSCEIADLTGVPLSTVKGRMRLALDKLAAYLKEKGVVDV